PANRVRDREDRLRGGTPQRVELKVTNDDGDVVFEGPVRPVDQSVGGDRTQVDLDVAPGRLRMQMSIQDASSRLLDTDGREIVVGPSGNGLALGSARVFRARTAFQFHAISGNPGATPVASRVFSRDERLLIRVPVYAPQSTTPTLTATLRGSSGKPM